MSQGKFAPKTESARLRRLAIDPVTELMFTQHSGFLAEQLGIGRPDCLRAIASGGVIKSEQSGHDWRRTVRGKDVEGNTITLVVTVVPTSDSRRKRIVVLDCARNNNDAEGNIA